MGRLEKQIIAGALALVGILLVVVVYRGLDPNGVGQGTDPLQARSEQPSDWRESGSGLDVVDLNSPKMSPPAKPPVATEPAPSGKGVALAIGADSSEPVQPVLDEAPVVPATADEAPPAKLVAIDLAAGQDWDPGLREYVVRPGDTLGHIAQRELGSYAHLDQILKLNEGIDPQRLKEGQKLTLPTHVPPRKSAAAATGPEVDSGVRSHVVVNGDTLWQLAERYYGPGQVQKILDANPDLRKDSVLQIGARIAVPE